MKDIRDMPQAEQVAAFRNSGPGVFKVLTH
jgi:hypothetical protein